jgi:CRP-like cAMP-binding protein
MDLHEQQALLVQFVNAIHPLTEEEAFMFCCNWQPFTAKRKTILTATGEIERYVYFVLDGVQRAYYVSDQDKEATIVFTYPLSFSGIADSLMTQLPSPYYFETLTASSFLRLSAEELFRMMEKYPNIRLCILKALAHALHGVLKRQAEILVFSNEEKFRTLLQRSPHLLNLVPHKYIASYLGIDPSNFSKLLKTVRI